MKKFISLNNSGGLGNQLALIVHQLAFCKESGAMLMVNNLEKNRNDFVFDTTTVSFLHKDKIGAFRHNLLNIGKRALNVLAKNGRWSLPRFYLLNRSGQVDRSLLTEENYLLLTSSWNVRFHDLVIKHAPVLRKEVRFSPAVEQQAMQFLQKHELTNTDLKIGIHIRRGDYEQFEGGRYFYSMDHYYDVMQRIQNLFPDKAIRFVIFSNESNRFENPLNYSLTYSTEPAIVDMCIMSKLDLLAGPPSTFSGTASFLGNVPFLELKDKTKKIEMQAFKVYEI